MEQKDLVRSPRNPRQQIQQERAHQATSIGNAVPTNDDNDSTSVHQLMNNLYLNQPMMDNQKEQNGFGTLADEEEAEAFVEASASLATDPWYDPTTKKIKVHPNTNDASAVYREYLKQENRVFGKTKKLLSLPTKVRKDKIRFVCISDTHSRLGQALDRIPPGDVLIHAGDFTYMGYPKEIKQFDETLAMLPHKYKIVIAGNHELSFDRGTESSFEEHHHYKKELSKFNVTNPRQLLTSCTYLEDSEISVYGYKIYGSPWQPIFGGWAFNVKRGAKLLNLWDKIPEDTDILVTHGPPLGHGDKARMGVRAGCVELLNTVEKRVKPKYHIFGHIHEGYGVTTNDETVFVNCSVCTVHYKPTNDAVIFDLPLLPGFSKE